VEGKSDDTADESPTHQATFQELLQHSLEILVGDNALVAARYWTLKQSNRSFEHAPAASDGGKQQPTHPTVSAAASDGS